MQNYNSTILLTGATGFLGSSILRKLVALDYSVIIIKRSNSNISRIKDIIELKKIKICNVDNEDLKLIFGENKINCIIHSATEYGRGDTENATVFESNVIFPMKLMELAIKHGVGCFINTDSYFNKSRIPYSGLFNYSLSKRTFLVWLKTFSKQIKIINITLEHLYGPNDSNTKFMEYVIQEIGVKKVAQIDLTQGLQMRDFVFIDDVVDAYLLLVEHGLTQNFAYQNYEIGTGVSSEISKVVLLIKEISKSGTILSLGKLPYRSGEIMDSKANISKMRSLGWFPKYDLEQGITKILDFYSNTDEETHGSRIF
jgi:nucleoside-diphosphate-sugar epimerase